MFSRNSVLVPTTIAFIAMTTGVFAQGPAGDRVLVTFDRPVQVGSQTLPAGEYLVRQVTSASNPRVLEFTSDNGTKLDATVTAIPILQNNAPSETKVILENEGGGARLSRIWVQGKNYGYEFPGKTVAATPDQAIRLEARYDAPLPITRPATAAEVAQTQQAETTAPAPTPAPAPVVIAQAAPEPAPAPQPPAVTETPAPAPQPIPATALGWVPMTFAGLSLAFFGLLLLWRSDRKVR